MIEAAENVAQHYNISRNDQDLFADVVMVCGNAF